MGSEFAVNDWPSLSGYFSKKHSSKFLYWVLGIGNSFSATHVNLWCEAYGQMPGRATFTAMIVLILLTVLQDWELAILKSELNRVNSVCVSGKTKSDFSPALYRQPKERHSVPEEWENEVCTRPGAEQESNMVSKHSSKPEENLNLWTHDSGFSAYN